MTIVLLVLLLEGQSSEPIPATLNWPILGVSVVVMLLFILVVLFKRRKKNPHDLLGNINSFQGSRSASADPVQSDVQRFYTDLPQPVISDSEDNQEISGSLAELTEIVADEQDTDSEPDLLGIFPEVIPAHSPLQLEPGELAERIDLAVATGYFDSDLLQTVIAGVLSKYDIGEFDLPQTVNYLDRLTPPEDSWSWVPLRQSDIRSEDFIVDPEDHEGNGEVGQGYFFDPVPILALKILAELGNTCPGQLLAFVSVVDSEVETDQDGILVWAAKHPFFFLITSQDMGLYYVIASWAGVDHQTLAMPWLNRPPEEKSSNL